MTILDVLKSVARQVKDEIPQSIMTGDDTTNELLGYAEHGAARIFNDFNWRFLEEETEIITSGGAESYNLPADFDSMISYGVYDLTSSQMLLCESADERLRRMAEGDIGENDMFFRLRKDKIVFSGPYTAEHHLWFAYKSKNYVKSLDDAGNIKYTDVFTADTDEFVLDNHLLIAATIAARSIGLQLDDTATRIQEYNELLEICKNKDAALYKRTGDVGSPGVLSMSKIMCNPGGSF